MTKHRTPVPRAQKGETLAEVLVALLIVALAALLLASMAAVSNSINIAARQKDDALYAALTAVEAMPATTTPQTGQVAIYDAAGSMVGSPYGVSVYSSGSLTFYKPNP